MRNKSSTARIYSLVVCGLQNNYATGTARKVAEVLAAWTGKDWHTIKGVGYDHVVTIKTLRLLAAEFADQQGHTQNEVWIEAGGYV